MLAIAVFLLDLAPLEVQRRAINHAIKQTPRLSSGKATKPSDRRTGVEISTTVPYEPDKQTSRPNDGMNFLMQIRYHFTILALLVVGRWFFIKARREASTLVAFISGLDRINRPSTLAAIS